MKYANERRNLGEFDKAEKAYDEVLKKNLSEHEARWGILLCRRGAIYLEDEATNTVVITCRKKVNSSIVTDPDFKRACEDAPIQVRRQYERDAEYIDAIQREIRSMTDADGCDIFICYKETEPNAGERTEDSVRALNLYQTLTRRGYRVFYAPVSLKNHLGANYEAAIFNAIETAQVMLVLGTKANYFSTTWMQSEWRRFLEKVDAGERKLLVPLYQNFSPSELPTEFADRFLQGLDMSDVGFVFDLENMLNKVVRKGNEPDELTKLRAEIERMKQLEEERLRNAAEEAQRKAEEERQRREEAERKAEEERKQREEAERRAEEEAQRKAEEERQRREEAERKRAAEEELKPLEEYFEEDFEKDFEETWERTMEK